MPRSQKRKRKSAKSTGPVPDLSRALAPNALAAEAQGRNITFVWRDIEFVVDLQAVKFGKAAFSIRVVNNDTLNVMVRMDAAMAVLEAAVGQEQLMQALAVEPNFFDDIEVIHSFWDAYTTAVYGAASGESQAS